MNKAVGEIISSSSMYIANYTHIMRGIGVGVGVGLGVGFRIRFRFRF